VVGAPLLPGSPVVGAVPVPVPVVVAAPVPVPDVADVADIVALPVAVSVPPDPSPPQATNRTGMSQCRREIVSESRFILAL